MEMYWTTPADTYVGAMDGLFGPRPALYSTAQVLEAERELDSRVETIGDYFNLTSDADAFARLFGTLREVPDDGWARHYLQAGMFLLDAWYSLSYRPSIVAALAIVVRLAHQRAMELPPKRLHEQEDIQVAAIGLQVMALRLYEDLLVMALKDWAGKGTVEHFAHFFEVSVIEWEPERQMDELRRTRAALSDASLTLLHTRPRRLVENLLLLLSPNEETPSAASEGDATRPAGNPPPDEEEVNLDALLANLAVDASSEPSSAPAEPAVPPHHVVLSPGLVLASKSAEGGLEPYAVLARPMPLAGIGRKADVIAAELERYAPWATDLASHVRRELRLRERMGHEHPHLRPLLLVGPPGSGKTAVAAALAAAMGMPLERIDAGGLPDNRDLAGTSAGWRSAHASRPVSAIARLGVANPAVLVDEIEKVATGPMNRSAQDTLLSMTEPGTAGSYYDGALRARVDISHVTWVMTANDLTAVPKPLLSRVAVIRVDRPGPAFAGRTIELVLEGIARDMGGTAAMLPDLPQAVLDQVVKHFAGGADLRRVKAALRAAVSLQMDAAVLH
ncbi:hypothetical protein CHU95_03270 [Niveispirillum lacus]|uniref:AAA+ ATPase domain-containing protein n=2 Tax=Niveispirillum lacus TaxID=1981099 RepID=A0A255Z7D3_9PROT|nr:hypothetical protein CHU95_03270 [Niveispirillum lacus]